MYSLLQGVADGFRAPYTVVRIGLDKDLDGWRPEDGQADKYGQVIEDWEYNERDYDPFDLVCHVAFDQPPLTRRERADGVRKRDDFGKYGDKARAVLEALLQKKTKNRSRNAAVSRR